MRALAGGAHARACVPRRCRAALPWRPLCQLAGRHLLAGLPVYHSSHARLLADSWSIFGSLSAHADGHIIREGVPHPQRTSGCCTADLKKIKGMNKKKGALPPEREAWTCPCPWLGPSPTWMGMAYVVVAYIGMAYIVMA